VTSRHQIYSDIILQEIPRLLGLQDREPLSPTFGCFDRTYWQWKFKDFPDARFQEAVLSLSWVWTREFPENIYYKNKNLLSWIEAGLRYWCQIQDHDGSYSEAYPREKSFVATGFSLFCVTETLLKLGNSISSEVNKIVISSVNRAAHWLCHHSETHAFISNHKGGSAVGLLNASQLTGKVIYQEQAQTLIREILARQSSEGWYSEYDGPDPGYETQGLYYLSVYYAKTHDQTLLESLRRSFQFLQYFVHPDGTIGGEYGRRNTTFCFPAAFEILASDIPLAAGLGNLLVEGIKQKRIPSAHTTDFFNSIPILNSVCLAREFVYEGGKQEPVAWSRGEFSRYFPKGGLWVVRQGKYYFIGGTKKGGVFKLFDVSQKRLLVQDCGYFIDLEDSGGRFASQSSESSQDVRIDKDGFSIECSFYPILHELLTPFKMIVLRCLNILGRLPRFSEILKKAIVRRLISSGKAHASARLERQVRLNNDGLTVVDHLSGLPKDSNVWHAHALTTYHMGSSRYFSISELEYDTGAVLMEISSDGTLLIEKKYH